MPGPLFAWVDDTDTTWSPAFARADLQVISFRLQHQEGDFAALSLEVVNPRVGLLAPGRPRWAWFSYDDGSSVTPLFFGRVIGLPSTLFEETVVLEFQARPKDFDARKLALADTLRDAPYWDPMWIDPNFREDPDAVFEARPEKIHVDRVTHEVTSSSIIEGEDGFIELGASEIFYDSLRLDFGEVPPKMVQVIATVNWDQQGFGTLDVTPLIKASAGENLLTLSGEGLYADWPEPGDFVGNGWKVGVSSLSHLDGTAVPQELVEVTVREPNLPGETVVPPPVKVQFNKFHFEPILYLDYAASRQRIEVLTLNVTGDCQEVVTDEEASQTLVITLATDALVEELPTTHGSSTDKEMPIQDLRRNAFFKTDRGIQSIYYLLMVARANLLNRARTAQVSFEIPFAVGLAADITCRKSARVSDVRLPDGICEGKIVSYAMWLTEGALGCGMTIACAVGKGETFTVDSGTPDYADGYADDYQTNTGGVVEVIPGEAAFPTDPLNVEVLDDGINFFDMQASELVLVTTQGTYAEQLAALTASSWTNPSEAAAAVNTKFTRICVTPRALMGAETGEPFQTNYEITAVPLSIPRLIDLEALVTG